MDDFSLSYTAKSAKENCKALAPVVNSLIDDAAKQGVFFFFFFLFIKRMQPKLAMTLSIY